MKNSDIARLRLRNQGLSEHRFTDPVDVVGQLGAVQAQDYAGAKWALGQRLPNTTDAALDQAFNAGRLLRTHILRPTWHFVAPADLRWMLELTGPRVHAANASMYRKLGLDQGILRKSYGVLEKALRGNQYLTRAELASRLDQAGIPADGLRLGYFMMSAELDGVICSGPRRGKQFTYALLEERASLARQLTREEALAELVRPYFTTRGPATLQDFTWWSGLTMADAKQGLELVKPQFVREAINGQTYWFPLSEPGPKVEPMIAHLLPNYDEFFIGFRDRSAIGEAAKRAGIRGDHPALIANVILIDGQIVGGWKRILKRSAVLIELNPIIELTEAESQAVADAANRYAGFLGLSPQLNW